MFMEINPQLFDECSHDYNERQNSADQRERARQSRWDKVAERAKDRQNGIAPPPMSSSAEVPVQVDEVDSLTNDSQKRLHNLKLDESGAPPERRATGGSVSPTLF